MQNIANRLKKKTPQLYKYRERFGSRKGEKDLDIFSLSVV